MFGASQTSRTRRDPGDATSTSVMGPTLAPVLSPARHRTTKKRVVRCLAGLTGQGNPRIDQVANGAAFGHGALFVLGQWAPDRAGCPAAGFVGVAVGQQRLRLADLAHLLGVVRPVGGKVQGGAGAQRGGGQRGELRPHQPALVVFALGPRVGEVDPDAVQRAGLEAVSQHSHRVPAQQPQVGQLALPDSHQQLRQSRLVDLDGEVVDLRCGGGQRGGGLAHPGTDLHDHRGRPAEPVGQVQRGGRLLEGAAVPCPARLPGAALAFGQPPAPVHEADHAPATLGSERLGHGRNDTTLPVQTLGLCRNTQRT